jgi:hypothetical protein
MVAHMQCLTLEITPLASTHTVRCFLFALVVPLLAHYVSAQNTPLISGGGAFFTSTNGGNTNYDPITEPVLAAPIGQHILVESRAAFLETFSPATGSQSGYSHTHFIGETYLQGDFIGAPRLTVVAGHYLIPFDTYNERLSPPWIANFQDSPLILPLGLLQGGSGLGGMLRGDAFVNDKRSLSYAYFYSTRRNAEEFAAHRGTGGRASLYLPEQRLELGLSYDRLLQGTHENFYGGYAWWEPRDTGLRLRSEFARGHHAQGGWLEVDYRLKAFGGYESAIGRIEPVFRYQQTFRRDTVVSDGLPLVNTQRADFGLDYNLPHDIRILTSYARQFSSSGNRNVWETGISYRFLFPAWKGK